MEFIIGAGLLLLSFSLASPLALVPRQVPGCPQLHIFGARETTAPPGFGTAKAVVDLVLANNFGATAEAIDYPACGGQASCGGIQYADSAKMGTAAVASAVNQFSARCPGTSIVLVGYSQGAQITDNAFCGGGDVNIGLGANEPGTLINASALPQIKAVIFMGSPRFVANSHSFNVGDCSASGFAPRPAGFTCAGASIIQSYCDDPDPFCCKGNDSAVHQGYGNKFGRDAAEFVQSLLLQPVP